MWYSTARSGSLLASYPGHVGGGKSGLVSTVCACANDSGKFSRTSPIMDKLHVVVIIIVINMVNTPRRVQRYRYNRNYSTTADTIASSSLWLK